MPVQPPHTMYGAMVIRPAEAQMEREGQAQDEAALIAAVQRGDAGSREALYHRYKRRIFALAVRIAGAGEAEEVVQEAFIRVFRGLEKFRGEAALSTWIYRLAVNAALSHRARRGTAPLRGAGDPSADELESHPAEEPERGDAVLRARLERALIRLPQGYRTVIVLHDVEGMEHEQVAEILGCHVGTSKSQLHKARAKLREILAAEGITASALETG
jgi:RNA polymerase sigma-70 factor (ECF subfamily)